MDGEQARSLLEALYQAAQERERAEEAQADHPCEYHQTEVALAVRHVRRVLDDIDGVRRREARGAV